MSLKDVPYWRLSSFYFFYFAVVGTVVPFLGLYLQSLDFSPQQIGVVSAIMMLTRVVAPNVWGWLSDYTGRRLSVIRYGAFLASLFFAVLLWRQSFHWVAFVVISYSFFWNAVLAQFEVITLAHLHGISHFYSRIRLWGSVGFIVAVVALGYLFDGVSISLFPWVALLLLILIWCSSLTVGEASHRWSDEHQQGRLSESLKSRAVLCFLAAAFFLQLSHGSYYTFYSVYLESLGYSRQVIGLLWALGVIAEVVIFWFMHRLVKHFGLRHLLLFTLAVTVLRWWLIGCYPQQVSVMIFAQLLHAFSFGCAHSVSIEFILRHFSGASQGQGQALYSAVSFGAGGAAGALISGWVWAASPVLSFALSALAAAIAMGLVWWGVRGQEVQDERLIQ
ncbi:MAG: MFS transporter [Cellvibrionaceae bacterium]|nr:MFS transporter [Cellvibrionaceae bacterium]